MFSYLKKILKRVGRNINFTLDNIGLVMGTGVVIAVVYYDASNQEAPNWLYLTAIVAAITFLKGFQIDLQKIKEYGLPVPVSYTDDVGFDWISNTETEKKIYIGYINEEVLKSLLFVPHSATELIINVRVFSDLSQEQKTKIFDTQNDTCIILSNVPSDYVAVFEYVKGLCNRATFIRKSVDSKNSYYSIRYSKHENLLKQMSDIHKECYIKGSSIEVNSSGLMSFVTKFYKERDIFNISDLNNGGKVYPFPFRSEFFNRCTALVKEANKSIFGIDLTPFESWEEDDVFKLYLEAHIREAGESSPDKRRIKIIDFDSAPKNLKIIESYIDKMNFINVEVRFLDTKFAKDEKNGAVIIDDEICVDFKNPDKGSEFGTISFLRFDIDIKRKAFDLYWSRNECLSKDDFLMEIK